MIWESGTGKGPETLELCLNSFRCFLGMALVLKVLGWTLAIAVQSREAPLRIIGASRSMSLVEAVDLFLLMVLQAWMRLVSTTSL